MAKAPVKLKVSGFKDERDVAEVSYSFTKGIDADGQPAGTPKGGLITLKVKALNNANCDLLEWLNDTGKGKKGSIEFMEAKDNKKKMKSVEFQDAYCVKFEEHWEEKSDDSKELAHYELITISCRKITNGSVTYENEWT